jgi:hypothetical protein
METRPVFGVAKASLAEVSSSTPRLGSSSIDNGGWVALTNSLGGPSEAMGKGGCCQDH